MPYNINSYNRLSWCENVGAKGFCFGLPGTGKNCQGFDEVGKFELFLVFSVLALVLGQFVAQGADTDSE